MPYYHMFFESPATTFRLVKATRLIANPDYYVIRIIIIVLLYFLARSLKKPLSFPKDFSNQTFIRIVPDLF